jgi:3-dehydroquinate synthase
MMSRRLTLETIDRHECRFHYFRPLKQLWNEYVRQNGSDSNESGMVIVDAGVRSIYEKRLFEVFPPDRYRYMDIPSGEASKDVSNWSRIIDFAFESTVRRNTPLIAAGGGVTGDLAGFAASTILRGLPLVHIPTTLLAMVDSSVGGKTGINHNYGKNTIGAFYHPRAVLFDITFLETLPQREWLCGISEILKYGFISDPSLLKPAGDMAGPEYRERPESAAVLQDLIERSVSIKADVVAGDAREAGRRAFLNFGHTFAHALESVAGYRNINHGEAVYAGMIAAVFVSRQSGADVSDKPLLALKRIYNLDLNRYSNRIDELIGNMEHDKKNRDEAFQLVLLEGSGRPILRRTDDRALLRDAWNYVFETLEPEHAVR